MSYDIDKAYISPYDKFLYEFDATHEKSSSQAAEIKKHARLAQLRDEPAVQDDLEDIWSDF